MELTEELLEDIEDAFRDIAIEPAITSNPGGQGEDAPLAVLVWRTGYREAQEAAP